MFAVATDIIAAKQRGRQACPIVSHWQAMDLGGAISGDPSRGLSRYAACKRIFDIVRGTLTQTAGRMIASFRNKKLQRFWQGGNAMGIKADPISWITKLLSSLDAAAKPGDMDLPGCKFHPLKGDRKGEFSVWVDKNWRVTLGWSGQNAVDVDYEDFH